MELFTPALAGREPDLLLLALYRDFGRKPFRLRDLPKGWKAEWLKYLQDIGVVDSDYREYTISKAGVEYMEDIEPLSEVRKHFKWYIGEVERRAYYGDGKGVEYVPDEWGFAPGDSGVSLGAILDAALREKSRMEARSEPSRRYDAPDIMAGYGRALEAIAEKTRIDGLRRRELNQGRTGIANLIAGRANALAAAEQERQQKEKAVYSANPLYGSL